MSLAPTRLIDLNFDVASPVDKRSTVAAVICAPFNTPAFDHLEGRTAEEEG